MEAISKEDLEVMHHVQRKIQEVQVYQIGLMAYLAGKYGLVPGDQVDPQGMIVRQVPVTDTDEVSPNVEPPTQLKQRQK